LSPLISIVTPSFRARAWLPLCVSSVKDQRGVVVEHVIQDSCSDDGTADWLKGQKGLCIHIEKDAGMYDALNRGLRRGQGTILGYLNCDEQYLPGTLAKVVRFFDTHPEVAIVFATALVVDPNGAPIALRRPIVPSSTYVKLVMLPMLTCSMFFRRRVLEKMGDLFDPSFKISGDADFFLRAVAVGLRIAAYDELMGTFTDTGGNLGLQAASERGRFSSSVNPLLRRCRKMYAWQYRVTKALRGFYRRRRVDYAIYTQTSPDRRVALNGIVSERWVGR
jgi:glycosyltransferase involved in cell wall biosynthesis